MSVSFACAYCGRAASQSTGSVNRARRSNRPLYCGRVCSGLGRRTDKTAADCKIEKRLYDVQYREENREVLAAKKRAYFDATYDPVTARERRKLRAGAHAEYCRREEYREWKRQYDLRHRASAFGEFYESYELLSIIETAIAERASRYEIHAANGTLNKALQRKRDYGKSYSS